MGSLAASPHYDDLIDPWLNGNYHVKLWTAEEIDTHKEGELILTPYGDD